MRGKGPPPTRLPGFSAKLLRPATGEVSDRVTFTELFFDHRAGACRAVDGQCHARSLRPQVGAVRSAWWRFRSAEASSRCSRSRGTEPGTQQTSFASASGCRNPEPSGSAARSLPRSFARGCGNPGCHRRAHGRASQPVHHHRVEGVDHRRGDDVQPAGHRLGDCRSVLGGVCQHSAADGTTSAKPTKAA